MIERGMPSAGSLSAWFTLYISVTRIFIYLFIYLLLLLFHFIFSFVCVIVSFVYMSILPKTYITCLHWFVERDIHCTRS